MQSLFGCNIFNRLGLFLGSSAKAEDIDAQAQQEQIDKMVAVAKDMYHKQIESLSPDFAKLDEACKTLYKYYPQASFSKADENAKCFLAEVKNKVACLKVHFDLEMQKSA